MNSRPPILEAKGETAVNIIMLGPPGCGKGTQAQRLIDKYQVPQISTGDLLRAAVKKGTELGKKAKTFMDAGQLVADEVVIGMVEERLKEKDAQPGFILDGFPRTVPQAAALDQTLGRMGKAIDKVISIEVPDDEVVGRLSGRRTCKGCGAMYHVKFNQPKKEGLCDKCGGQLDQRDDDNEKTIRNRLQVYHDQTAPLVSYYGKKDLVRGIPGTGEINGITQAIMKALEK